MLKLVESWKVTDSAPFSALVKQVCKVVDFSFSLALPFVSVCHALQFRLSCLFVQFPDVSENELMGVIEMLQSENRALLVQDKGEWMVYEI